MRSSILRLLACLALTAPPILAGGGGGGTTVVDTFTGGVNLGGWSYGGIPDGTFANGGNPGAFHGSQVDTFAPQLRTTTPGSDFLGDYKAKNVVSLGVDLRTISTQFPFAREATLMLSNGTCTVFRLGTDFVPQVAEGWKSIDVAIDPHSATLPAGWAVLGGSSCTDPDAAWSTVMSNVTEVRWFYGHPEFFFIFDIWQVGADNLRIANVSPWTDLGGGTVGINGQPTATGFGTLQANTAIGLSLVQAPPSTIAGLWMSIASTPFNVLGGTLYANPLAADLYFTTTPAGTLSGQTIFPPGFPVGSSLYFQFLCYDPSTLHDITLSNGLRATVP